MLRFKFERVLLKAVLLTIRLSGETRHICEWPAYQIGAKMTPNYDAISKRCHVFRNYGDILDAWSSVDGIINHYAEHQDIFSNCNGINEFTLNIDFISR